MSLLDVFLNQLNIPEKCKVDKTVFKKLFEQANDGKHPANTALPSDPISLNLVPT